MWKFSNHALLRLGERDYSRELISYMQMGYQNVLKTAMTIGLTELYNQVSNHKLKKAPPRRNTKQMLTKYCEPGKTRQYRHTIAATGNSPGI
jgi:hypothetical protein